MWLIPKQDAVWSVYPCSLSMADQGIFARCYIILDLTYTRIYHATSSAKIPVLLMKGYVESRPKIIYLWFPRSFPGCMMLSKIRRIEALIQAQQVCILLHPVQILAISCDRLNVQVPWSHLRSRPVQVKVGHLRIQARLPTGKSWGARSNNCELVVKVHFFYYSRWTHKWLYWVFSFQQNFDDNQDNQPPALITNHFTDRFQRCFIFTPSLGHCLWGACAQ